MPYHFIKTGHNPPKRVKPEFKRILPPIHEDKHFIVTNDYNGSKCRHTQRELINYPADVAFLHVSNGYEYVFVTSNNRILVCKLAHKSEPSPSECVGSKNQIKGL